MTADNVATWVTIVGGCVGILAALVAAVRWMVNLRRKDQQSSSNTPPIVLVVVIVTSGITTALALGVSSHVLRRLQMTAPVTALAGSGAPWPILGGALAAVVLLAGGWFFLRLEQKRAAKVMRQASRRLELDR